MKLEVKTDGDDFVTYSLYVQSKSARVIKRRQRTRLVYPILYFIVALWFLLSMENPTMAIIFVAGAFAWYFIYPIWERRRYVKHYQQWIKDTTFKKNFDRPFTIQFNNDFFSQVRGGNETKFDTKEVLEMNEIGSYIFVKFDGGRGFIFPKEKIDNINAVREELKEIAKNLNVPYNIELDWKWK